MADEELVGKISRCAQKEISRMLGGDLNYYMIDFSRERIILSKKEVLKNMRIESLSNQAIHYISYCMDLFDDRAAERMAIDSVIRKRLDNLLNMNFHLPSDEAFSAVQKLHQEKIYASNFDKNPWINMILASCSGAWIDELMNNDFFDGMEDILQGWMEDVFNNFNAFAFFGVVKAICTQNELSAIFRNIEGKSRENLNSAGFEKANQLISDMQLVQ